MARREARPRRQRETRSRPLPASSVDRSRRLRRTFGCRRAKVRKAGKKWLGKALSIRPRRPEGLRSGASIYPVFLSPGSGILYETRLSKNENLANLGFSEAPSPQSMAAHRPRKERAAAAASRLFGEPVRRGRCSERANGSARRISPLAFAPRRAAQAAWQDRPSSGWLQASRTTF